MTGQLSIYDLFYPDRIDPLRECARRASPQWVQSRGDLIRLANEDLDIERWTRHVRHEYCPYGLIGHYSMSDRPNALTSWDMRTEDITITYNDPEGVSHTIIRSWQDFAREVMDLIRSGEYSKEEQ